MKKIVLVSSVLAIGAGLLVAGSGIGGLVFTYASVARENITTPADAAIPNTPVRGPLTLKAQADIVRTHALRMTGGKTYAEMPRQIPKLDADGIAVIDEAGKPVMTANTDRDIWVTATTLITAMHLGILTYAFCALALFLGLLSIGAGCIGYAFARK